VDYALPETDMPDDLIKKAPTDRTKKGSADRLRINVNEPWELRYWAKELNTTEEHLKAAVKAVGVQVKDVRKQLGK
jgi:hypothetical protein